MLLQIGELKELMKNKFMAAGLKEEHAEVTSEILAWSELRGWASHGSVRVEYYSERIFKGGITNDPNISWEETGPCTGILDGDNGIGYYMAHLGMEKAIEMAKKTGVAVVGMKRISHSGSIGYYTEMARDQDLVAITMCQSDPMAVPYGGTEPYFGTHPIAFSAPGANNEPIMFDMATTVQAWGKILDKKSKNEPIPDDWAVDETGAPTTDPHKVNALVPIAGPKGYGLMFMIDVLSGVLLGAPFGKHISSMYHDLSVGRELGQLHIVIDPERFVGLEKFKNDMSAMTKELSEMKPAPGFDGVYYPGQRGAARSERNKENGVDVVDDIYQYLISDDIHFDRYDGKNRFAE